MKPKALNSVLLILGTLGSPLLADNWTTTTSGKITSSSTTNIGIGTTTIGSKIQVNGNAAIGYSSSMPAPSNGLAVSGNVNIGGSVPSGAPASGVLVVANLVGNGVYPVTAYGAKTSNTDNTSQFTAALSAASAAGGGIVFIPPGQFKITGTLTIPRGVTLKGSWAAPHDAWLNLGTTLLAYSGRDNASGTPFITMQSDATLEGFTIYYPSQNNVSDIHAYPFTIRGVTNNVFGLGNFSITNVTLGNSYQGIQMIEHHERHFLKNVYLTALNLGVDLDDCTDIGKLEDVHIHNRFWWTAGNLDQTSIGTLMDYTLHNMTGFRFKHTDWEQIRNSFVIYAKTGMEFMPGATGNPSALMINSGVDHSNCALNITGVWPQTGLEIVNCQFLGYIRITGSGTGPVKMSNTNIIRSPYIWDTGYLDYLIVKQDNENLIMSNCTFSAIGAVNAWWALALQNGAAVISNSEFRADLANYGHVWVSGGATAIVTNNLVRGSNWKTAVDVGSSLIESNNIKWP